ERHELRRLIARITEHDPLVGQPVLHATSARRFENAACAIDLDALCARLRTLISVALRKEYHSFLAGGRSRAWRPLQVQLRGDRFHAQTQETRRLADRSRHHRGHSADVQITQSGCGTVSTGHHGGGCSATIAAVTLRIAANRAICELNIAPSN